MCVICVLFDKGKLTVREAKRACWEVIETGEVEQLHLEELYGKLKKMEKEDHAKSQTQA